MPNQQLIDFIKSARVAGQTDEQIKAALRQAGWQNADIEADFQPSTPVPSPNYSSPNISHGSVQGGVAMSHGGSSKKVGAIAGVSLIILVGGAVTYFLISRSVSAPNKLVTIDTQGTQVQPPTAAPENKVCDNYECVIAAASVCQPLSAVVSYSNAPFPLFPGTSASGRTRYEIKKSSSVSDCELIQSSLNVAFSLSEEARNAALARNVTEEEITTQLAAMNESANSTAARTSFSCRGSTAAIASYLTDTKNHLPGKGIQATMKQTIYTTTNDQTVICVPLTQAAQ